MLRYAEWVLEAGRFPHDRGSFLTPGGTIAAQDEEFTMLEGTNFAVSFFLPALVPQDIQFASKLSVEGDPVHFLQLIPITREEWTFVREKGSKAMFAELARRSYLPIFDPSRDSCF